MVIPQIILGGVISPLRGVAKWLGDAFVTVRWGQQVIHDLLPRSGIASEGSRWVWPLAIVLAHALVAASLTILALVGKRRSTRGS